MKNVVNGNIMKNEIQFYTKAIKKVHEVRIRMLWMFWNVSGVYIHQGLKLKRGVNCWVFKMKLKFYLTLIFELFSNLRVASWFQFWINNHKVLH